MKKRTGRKTLAKLDKIEVVSWEWDERAAEVGKRPGERAIGVIAQQLARQFPDLVRKHADGYRRVDYAGLAAVVLAGLQELVHEHDLLVRRVKKIEKTLGRAPSRATVRRSRVR